jgi:hypothetical protein
MYHPSFDKFFFLPADGTRGGIVLAWQSALVSVSHPHYTDNALMACISIGVDQSWWFTGVYGPQRDVASMPSYESCRISVIFMWGLGWWLVISTSSWTRMTRVVDSCIVA